MTDSERRNVADIAERWWHDLISVESGRRATRGGRRASRAHLRRAATPLEVMYESEALRLIARLPNENPERQHDESMLKQRVFDPLRRCPQIQPGFLRASARLTTFSTRERRAPIWSMSLLNTWTASYCA